VRVETHVILRVVRPLFSSDVNQNWNKSMKSS
jgi:hypothetical protein